ncbi:MAG: restriction endonuclease subunit S [Acidithiobacillus sp.]|nr:restriction endonuclease subunit S [Acidithiobacillus sp.]
MTQSRLTPLLVGQCPNDWKQVFINEVTELLTNGYVGPSLPYQTEDSENGVRYLQGFNVRPNKIDFTNATWVTKEFHERNAKSCLREGDLLVVQSGHIGTAAVVPENAVGSNCHALIISRFNQDKVDPHFVSQYINSEIGQARLRGLEVGSSMLHINTSELGRFILPLPPIGEQRRLAEILRLWDSAIEKTEQLIAGQERHYGYELSRLISRGPHPHRHVGAFAKEVSERNRGGNEARVLSVTNSRGFVLPEDQFERRVASADLSNYKVVHRGQYAYNPSRINVGSIARLDGWDDGVLSPMYVVFQLNENVNSDYFLHWLNSHEARQRIKKSAQGSVRETVSFSEFAAITIPLPDTNSQSAIARYLNVLREEIDLLGKSVAALKTQKRGLMQKLLTGHWRLPIKEETNT